MKRILNIIALWTIMPAIGTFLLWLATVVANQAGFDRAGLIAAAPTHSYGVNAAASAFSFLDMLVYGLIGIAAGVFILWGTFLYHEYRPEPPVEQPRQYTPDQIEERTKETLQRSIELVTGIRS